MAVNLSETKMLPAVAGVRLASVCAKIKSRKRDDLTVIKLDAGASVAGVFTQNRFAAAPVIVCREHLADSGGSVRGLVINAGIANAGTDDIGLRDARQSCRLLAQQLHCRATRVLPFSTGVIMEYLPMQRYADGIRRCAQKLTADGWAAAAQAIMTTDTVPKGAFAHTAGGKTVTGISKGSGMIHPNMATMLAFVATDAAIAPQQLARWQKQIAADTFNAVSVDGDTSTNDSFILIATGKAGNPAGKNEEREIKRALHDVCARLADMIIRDGEGAQKLLVINVRGGGNRAACRCVADSICRSPLVKTAVAAGDANVGRLLMAIGNANTRFKTDDLRLSINGRPVIRGGGKDPAYNEKKVTAEMAKDELVMDIQIGNGAHAATLKTCDLTSRYIEINAAYRS